MKVSVVKSGSFFKKFVVVFGTFYFISGCVATKQYINPNIQDPELAERQYKIDHGYCTQCAYGAVPMPEIRNYGQSDSYGVYSVTGQIHTHNLNTGGMSNSNYSGTIHKVGDSNSSFHSSFALGQAIGQALKAKEIRDTIYEGCMTRLGWVVDNGDSSKSHVKTNNERTDQKTASKENDKELSEESEWILFKKKLSREIEKLENSDESPGVQSDKLYDLWYELNIIKTDPATAFFEKSYENAKLKEKIEEIALSSGSLHAMYNAGYMNYLRGKNNYYMAQVAEEYDSPVVVKSQKGFGDERFASAIDWFKKSSDYPPSAEMLGLIYSNGYGVEKSNFVALKYYHKAGTKYLEIGEEDKAISVLEKMHKIDKDHELTKDIGTKIGL